MQTKISWINIDIVLTQKLNWARQNMLGTLKKVLNTKEVLVKEWRRRLNYGGRIYVEMFKWQWSSKVECNRNKKKKGYCWAYFKIWKPNSHLTPTLWFKNSHGFSIEYNTYLNPYYVLIRHGLLSLKIMWAEFVQDPQAQTSVISFMGTLNLKLPQLRSATAEKLCRSAIFEWRRKIHDTLQWCFTWLPQPNAVTIALYHRDVHYLTSLINAQFTMTRNLNLSYPSSPIYI